MSASTVTEAFGFGDLESYRRELTGYCYRILASPHDAEDAVEDTLIRAWQARTRFVDRPADHVS